MANLYNSIKTNFKESDSMIYGYRSIGDSELDILCNNETVVGRYNNSTEKQNDSKATNVVCFFTEPYKWEDAAHYIHIKCQFNKNDIVDFGTGIYYAGKSLGKTKVWTGRRGKTGYKIDEFYVSSYNIDNVVAVDYNIIDKKFNRDYSKMYTDKLKQHNIKQLNKEE